MDLKSVLGDAYKDGMSFEEIASALAEIPGPAENAKLKAALDKATHEAADNKRALREKQTAEEAAAADQKKQLDDMQAELEKLRNEKKLGEFKAKFLGLGFGEDAANKAAKAQLDGDTDAVFTALLARQQEVEKAAKKQSVMDSDVRPASGSGSAAPNYVQLAEEARKNGDGPAVAYYTRLMQLNQD